MTISLSDKKAELVKELETAINQRNQLIQQTNVVTEQAIGLQKAIEVINELIQNDEETEC
tara:strand:+ start:1249 stop:1428 length:180 start_codon:yes stop_codon:yes gene_type:complete